MADDWRLTIELVEEADSSALMHALRDVELSSEERARLGDRVVVSRDEEGLVFVYSDTEERARAANAIVRSKLDEFGFAADVSLSRWHPVEQRWEDPSVPLPRTEEEWQAEHERLQAREEAESLASGHAEWEVRVELASHDETAELAEQLEAEGLPVVRRATFLLVGAVNEDEAHALAGRLEREAPKGSRVDVEPGGRMVWEVAPQNPFAIFGGFGG